MLPLQSFSRLACFNPKFVHHRCFVAAADGDKTCVSELRSDSLEPHAIKKQACFDTAFSHTAPKLEGSQVSKAGDSGRN